MTLHIVSEDDGAVEKLRDIFENTVPGSGKINWHIASAIAFCFGTFALTIIGAIDVGQRVCQVAARLWGLYA